MTEILEYRGHIRNWRALCAELGISPELTREEREPEILRKAYEVWGTEMGNHLHGMFAFALRDEARGEIFCLRDPFGTKPFYYAVTEDGRFLYGTMIRQILEAPGFEKVLNEKMLQIYLTLTYTAGEETFFKGIRKLLPGHYLIRREDGSITIGRYFAPQFRPDEGPSLEDWADEIHTTLAEIMTEVKEDGETAESFLSGGVDSSYVFAMSDAQMSDSCGYEDPRFDESPLAAETARLLGRQNSRCLITPERFFETVPYVMRGMEQPLGDASAIVFAIGCMETAKHTKLCYSGEGADEFFGGYNMYRNAERYGDNLPTFYVGNTNIMKEEEKADLLLRYDPSFRPIDLVQDIYKENEGLDPLARMSDIDIRIWLEGDIYLNVDKMSTAAGLEVRMPLTDRRIFDIASRMPSRFKVNAEQNKVAFRTAAAKVLPQEVAFRKKLGFIVPIRHWLADETYGADMRRRFKSETAAKFFKPEALDRILQEYLGGNSDLWRKVWTIYTFLVWYDEYFN